MSSHLSLSFLISSHLFLVSLSLGFGFIVFAEPPPPLPAVIAAMSGEDEENAAELKIGEEFLKAKCLMNAEVALILDRKFEQLQQISDDPNQISQVFEKSMQYVKRFSRYKNPDAVRQIREILSRNRLAEFELCVLGNLCPETVEEAIAMVPSIKNKGRALDDDAIEKMLHDLSLIKKFV